MPHEPNEWLIAVGGNSSQILGIVYNTVFLQISLFDLIFYKNKRNSGWVPPLRLVPLPPINSGIVPPFEFCPAGAYILKSGSIIHEVFPPLFGNSTRDYSRDFTVLKKADSKVK